MEKEGYLERLGREIAEARQRAAIRELKRALAAGKFPENDDTIAAFAAGYYAAFEFTAEQKKAAEPPISGGFAFISLITAAMLAGLCGLLWWVNPPSNSPATNALPLTLAAAFGLLGYGLWQRARKAAMAKEAAFKEKWA